jgi:hypothetical protein
LQDGTAIAVNHDRGTGRRIFLVMRVVPTAMPGMMHARRMHIMNMGATVMACVGGIARNGECRGRRGKPQNAAANDTITKTSVTRLTATRTVAGFDIQPCHSAPRPYAPGSVKEAAPAAPSGLASRITRHPGNTIKQLRLALLQKG